MPPKPLPNTLTEPFWDALRQRGELLVPTCQNCDTRFFVPEPCCTACGSAAWEWTASSGIGNVYSATVVHQSASPDKETPFVLAIVEMDEGWSLLTHITGDAAESVSIGASVHFAPTTVDDELTLPTFALD